MIDKCLNNIWHGLRRDYSAREHDINKEVPAIHTII
jgi:hypothetical protein